MNNSNLNWKTKDGKFIPLNKLSGKELEYILKFINNNTFSYYSGVSVNQWRKAVKVHLVLDKLLTNVFGNKVNNKFKTKRIYERIR